MDLSEREFLRFVDLTYQSLEQPQQWRTLHEELRLALAADAVHVVALDRRSRTLSYSVGVNLAPQGELDYLRHYHRLDPRLPLVVARPPLAWTHCAQELDEAFVATDPFYQDYLLPQDLRYMSATKLVDDGEATIVFSVLCSAARGPLRPQALAFLDRLLPHLARACRIGLLRFVHASRGLVGQLLLQRLRQPVLLMTPGGAVLHANEAADQLLRRTGLVQVVDGMLRLPQPWQDELLARCAALEQQRKAGAGAEGFQALRIAAAPAGGGQAEVLHAIYDLLAPQVGASGARPVVVLIFYHPESAPAIDPQLLLAVFGLTPVECRIAALLAEGRSLKEIAEAHGTQHDTVRKQLRSIYQKTGTNRQPDLIRLLLHLPHNAARA